VVEIRVVVGPAHFAQGFVHFGLAEGTDEGVDGVIGRMPQPNRASMGYPMVGP
jgi:hypothetical protein